MEAGGLSKKEYLKKYLSGGGKDKKKKKKKSTQSLIIKSKIVDDDIDLKNMKPVDSDDLEIFDIAEEAPQIVGIIDERPEEIRVMSEYRSTKKWKIVTDEYGVEDVKITAIDRTKSNEGSPTREKEISIEIRKNSTKKKTDSDESSPIINESRISIKKVIDTDSSNKKENYNSNAFPPRQPIKKEKDVSPAARHTKNYDSDASPPRKIKKEKDLYNSPARKTPKNEDSDASPPRRRQYRENSGESSFRKRKENSSHYFSKKNNNDNSLKKKKKEKNDSDSSPSIKKTRNDDSDSSPPRNKQGSLERNSRGCSRDKRNTSESSRNRRSSELESSLKKNGSYGLKVTAKNNDRKNEKKSSQLERTLSGKKAGLQSAADMKKEGETLRLKEKEIFEKMSDDVTGKHATTIVRDRRTGKHHDVKEEARKRREKEEKEAEKIAQYAVWGKGVKQVQNRQDKMKEDLYEMSKPLARYKDDKDLEEMLKNQEREGDPMLEYIRKKKKCESEPSRPEYQGSYMPNRYGIRPGHKWDGVDRSNGYEKRWFEEQNAKKAREEEAFKWSTIDM